MPLSVRAVACIYTRMHTYTYKKYVYVYTSSFALECACNSMCNSMYIYMRMHSYTYRNMCMYIYHLPSPSKYLSLPLGVHALACIYTFECTFIHMEICVYIYIIFQIPQKKILWL